MQVQKVAAAVGGVVNRAEKVDVGPERILEEKGDLQWEGKGS